MAEDETPELVEVEGYRVYKVSISWKTGCGECPFMSNDYGCRVRHISDALGRFPCGPYHFFLFVRTHG